MDSRSETETTAGDSKTAIPEIVLLAAQIGEAIGFSFEDAGSPATSAHLNDDGAWEYHFQTDDRWGFLTAAPGDFIQTTYPGWNTITVQGGHWAIFFEGTFAGTVSPHGGRIGGCALLDWDADTDLETAVLDAFRTERAALTEQDQDPTAFRGNPMADALSAEDDRPGTDDSRRLQRYGIWAAKGSLCVLCWIGFWVALVIYGPPAVSVPISPGPPSPNGVVPAVLGILLAAGFATILTIVLGVFVLASVGWQRDRPVGGEDSAAPTENAKRPEEPYE